ncbi:complement C4-B isoform 1-T1 [Menidia menidia]
MKSITVLILLLIGIVGGLAENRFFVFAPNVFHLGVKEKVFVQMEGAYLEIPVKLYLETEKGLLMSEKVDAVHDEGKKTTTVELMIRRDDWIKFLKERSNQHNPPYLNLIAEDSFIKPNNSPDRRKMTRVLVLHRRGYIFIQTDQPIYNPTQRVQYRIFTLDHMLRPNEEPIFISVINAAGSTVMKSSKVAPGGIYRAQFSMPSVSKMGIWKIKAHYEGDQQHAAVREFKVQKFVLPSFDVNIAMEQRYILLNDATLDFTISAMYTYGEKVKGAYHCQFGVVTKSTNRPDLIRGLELMGSVQDGAAKVTIGLEQINSQLKAKQNQTLSDLWKKGSQIYFGVFVTNIQSGEIQEAEVHLPILSQRYTIDLSRTRSHFIPGFPLDVVAVISHPDGSPAAGMNVNIKALEESREYLTNQEGMVFTTFNIQQKDSLTVEAEVSVGDQQERKTIKRAVSPTNSFLYMATSYKLYSVKDVLKITFSTVNAPSTGHIYYMVISRGIIVNNGALKIGVLGEISLQITAELLPSFRVVGYYYNANGDIIADSIWVDVRDECEITVKVKQEGSSEPGKISALHFDLHGQRAKVALLAVDKAFYALNYANKLTAKQVFSTMTSYDLGCSSGGGNDSLSAVVDAGLSFVSKSKSKWRQNFKCNSESARPRRSADAQQKLKDLISESNFDAEAQECCSQGFSVIPMKRTCEERRRRVLLVKGNETCADAFLICCKEAEKLIKERMLENAQSGFGRTATTADIEEFFLNAASQYIRRFFPPSFAFTEFDVNGKKRHSLALPDSITTWEVQVVTLSATTGFCVVKPYEIKAFKKAFVSLRLPYTVKKYEQMSISPVIYNYADEDIQVAVHMEQTEGLCSPASATTSSFVNITVGSHSSQFVSFSVVPMKTGSLPIKIRLYDIEKEWGIDAIEKKLNVLTEGKVEREEITKVIKLDEGSSKTLPIDGTLPGERVPDSGYNIFVSVEGDGFENSYAKKLLSPETVSQMIKLPKGCLEQTLTNLTSTIFALRYLDLSDQWFYLPAGKRDEALYNVETGYRWIIEYHRHKQNGFYSSYGSFSTVPYSNWATALVVKILSLIAERQNATVGLLGRPADLVPEEEIWQSVDYLVSQQQDDGSFPDPNPVLHRNMLGGADPDASMTAFITIALNWARGFLTSDNQPKVRKSILEATSFLQTKFSDLEHPYAVAISAYCLSVCLPQDADRSFAWKKLQSMATKTEDDCYLWTNNPSPQNQKKSEAITIVTTAYALLTAVAVDDMEWAAQIACWLSTQENYFGGFRSTQDTVVALEALSEYELKRPKRPDSKIKAHFTVKGRNEVVEIKLESGKEKVEIDLKKFAGKKIDAQLTGKGEFKLKMAKAYHLLGPEYTCDGLSISVAVEGKVKYTAKILENYDYNYDYDANDERGERVPDSVSEWFDTGRRNRRDLENNVNSENVVTYTVCVRLGPNSNLTGMAIADITLLSGFMAIERDLDRLMEPPEQYITHYELSFGKVLIYFNQLFEREECFSFDAEQTVQIGLLQPVQAVFYDYYEPNRKCTVFYAAPKRSRMVSKLCSGDVCQCAERPCHTLQDTFKRDPRKMITKATRMDHACFFPTVDYAYIVTVHSVSMKSNFELYKTNVTEVLKFNGDMHVSKNAVRVFAKRLHCKGQLDLGKQYLIMGKDGATTDLDGQMQYLLESNTWVEQKPLAEDCKKSAHRRACTQFDEFVNEYKLDGCTQ